MEGTATANIAKLKAKRDIPNLIKTLSFQNDEVVRRAAVCALKELGWQPDDGVDGAAYWVAQEQWSRCVQIGAPAVPPLLIAANEGRESVRHAVVDTFIQIGPPAVEALIDALELGSTNIYKAAIAALGKIGDTRAVEPLLTVLELAWYGPDVTCVAIDALGQIGDTRVIEPLIACLKREKRQIRVAAVEALSKIGDSRSVAPLLDLLNDKDEFTRTLTIRSLGQVGDARAVRALIPLLQSQDWATRKTTAEALLALFQSNQLDEKSQRTILAQRSVIAQEHEDLPSHLDVQKTDHYQGHASDCIHDDSSTHKDSGIGITFPV